MTTRVWWFPDLPEGSRVLEIGSGAGHFVNAAKARGWEVEHFDPAHGDPPAEKFYFGIRRYDAIFAWQVIEHFRDPLRVMTSARFALNHGGYLCLSTPSTRSLECRLMGQRWDAFDRPDHRHWFSPTSLRLLLWYAGFSDVRVMHQRVVKHVRGPRWLLRTLGVLVAALHISSRITVVARVA